MESFEIKILSEPSAVAKCAAAKFIALGNRAISDTGRFTVALAGGSTPRSLYRLLADEFFRPQIDWDNVFFFFGDERAVLPDAAESNYRMANETLFRPLGTAHGRVFRWKTELSDPLETALRYEEMIRSFFELESRRFPRFDLVFLGMGEDGHTASLFPHTPALNESSRIAVANRVKKLASFRLTLTVPVLNNASNIIFLVTGANKANPLKEVLEGEFQPDMFPSQLINPANGRLEWLVDEAAAGFLDR